MSEELQLFLTQRLEVWKRLAEPFGVRLAFFACLLALTLLVRGRSAWTLRATLGVLATIALVHLNFVVMPFVRLVVDALQASYDGLGLPRVPATFWAGVPAWVVALVAVVALDLANYWNHRLMHTPLVWPVHAIHHSDPDVSGMTTFRVHALETLVMLGSHVVLLTWLGLPAEALGVLALVLVLHNMYVHTDVDWTHGPLELLVASPRFHRWHHADVPEAYGKNLANVIPLFDVVFGTYHCPGPCEVPLGAAGVPRHDPLRLFLYPGAAWLLRLREAAGAAARRVASRRAAA